MYAPVRAIASSLRRLYEELASEKESVEHLHKILAAAAIDESSQLLPYNELIFAFARSDTQRMGFIDASLVGEALQTLGIAAGSEAGQLGSQTAVRAEGERLDFAAFARVASLAYLEHVKRQSEREELVGALRQSFDRRDRMRRGLIEAADCEHVLRDAGMRASSDAVRSVLTASRYGSSLDLIAVLRVWDALVARGYKPTMAPGMTEEERARRAALRKAFAKYDQDNSGRCATPVRQLRRLSCARHTLFPAGF
jgi:Ca2+-binding EF-hand superfamily protein